MKMKQRYIIAIIKNNQATQACERFEKSNPECGVRNDKGQSSHNTIQTNYKVFRNNPKTRVFMTKLIIRYGPATIHMMLADYILKCEFPKEEQNVAKWLAEQPKRKLTDGMKKLNGEAK